MTTPRATTIYRSRVLSPDTTEYCRARLTTEPATPGAVAADLTMDVEFSFDRVSWYRAEWLGAQWTDEDTKNRVARLLLTEDNLPTNGKHTLYARPFDTTEHPIISAGTVTVA